MGYENVENMYFEKGMMGSYLSMMVSPESAWSNPSLSIRDLFENSFVNILYIHDIHVISVDLLCCVSTIGCPETERSI